MSVHYRIQGEYLLIVGHTYPHRDDIKSLGATFDRQDKVWKLTHSESNLHNLDRFCQRVGGGALDQTESFRALPSPPPIAPQAVPVVVSETAGITVAELVQRVQVTISQSFAQPLWLIGEIENCKERGTGFFFQLAESKDAHKKGGTISVSATLWASTLRGLKNAKEARALLADGLQIRVLCQVGLYRDRGMISLNILDIDPNFTKGALALAREALLRELRAQGLDQKNKQTRLTRFPWRIGLVSADGSRAQTDFLDQLKVYGFSGQVIFADARMQGESLTVEVAKAVRDLCQSDCDLIVITRGGGSAADLRWFDTKEVALAVAHCPVPILAAIGHHEDICIAEEIAFRREKTPTAAADFIISQLQATRDTIEDQARQIASQTSQRLDIENARLVNLKERILQNMLNIATRWEVRLARLSDAIATQCHAKFLGFENKLAEMFGVLQSKDPSPWMQQGWTQLLSAKGRVRSVADAEVGETLHARLTDGWLDVSVDKKNLGVKPL